MSDSTPRPPRDGLFRASMPGLELRAAEAGTDEGPVMAGHFAVTDQWTEINSMWEGNFLERFAPGAFKKTIREGRPKMRVLFQHGMDPQLGDKPLGPIRDLREDDEGAYYEVPLLDAPYVRDNVLPGLEAGLYGASFRFRVLREEWSDEPDPSDDNPKGLPERTVKEAQVSEFGPVTFPAYEGASAGLRSMTDDFIVRCFERDPQRLRQMFNDAQPLATTEEVVEDEGPEVPAERSGETPDPAPSEGEAGTGSHLADERREPTATASRGARKPIYGQRRKETSKPWLLGPLKSTKRS